MHNNRYLVKYSSLDVLNFLRSEESRTESIPKPCLWCFDMEILLSGAAKVVSQSFDYAEKTKKLQPSLFKIFFMMGSSVLALQLLG